MYSQCEELGGGNELCAGRQFDLGSMCGANVDCVDCWLAGICIRGLGSGFVAFFMRAVALGPITSVFKLVKMFRIAGLRVSVSISN